MIYLVILIILIGFLILASQKKILGQITGFFTLEAGIILAEYLSPHHQRWEIKIGLGVVFIWTVIRFWQFTKLFSKESEKL